MSPLHDLGDALRSGLMMIPLSVVRGVVVCALLALIVWVLRLPTERTTPPGRAGRWDEDLKVWAWIALSIQVVIYCAL
jgi:hypothetical protein